MISVKYRNEISRNGYSLDELKSGLQKYLRRGMAKEACYCLNESLSFNEIESEEEKINVKRIGTNFFHRLMIICMEDIGPNMLFYEKEIDDLLMKFREEKKINVGIDLICLLCSLYKSRDCSWWKYYWKEQKVELIYDIDKSIIDIHFKKESVELKHYINEFIISLRKKEHRAVHFAFKIYEFEKTETQYFRSKDVNRLIFYILNVVMGIKIETYMKWFKEIKGCMEEFLCWHIVIIMYLKDPVMKDRIEINKKEVEKFVKENKNKKLLFDDWVYDKHTKKGKFHKERGTDEYFWNISSVVIPEDPSICILYKDSYCNRNKKQVEEKKVEEKKEEEKKEEKEIDEVKKESEMIEFKIRAQLLCGNSKTDTYFGIIKKKIEGFEKGEFVFVKGPFKSTVDVDNAIYCNEVKKKMGLNYLRIKKIKMICDIFEKEEIIMGVRTQFINKEGWFMICENINEIEDMNNIPYEIKNSTKYKNVKVLDSAKLKIISDKEVKGYIGINYILLLMYRYYLGIPDIANRNFMIKDEKIYSIDEDIIGKEVKFKMNKKIKENIKKVLNKNKSEIIDKIKEWNNLPYKMNKIEADIEEIIRILL